MRKGNMLIMILLFHVFISKGQDSISIKDRFLKIRDSKLDKTEDIFLLCKKIILSEDQDFKSNMGYSSLIEAYNLNVIKYYNLNSLYDTELKRKYFKQTEEYQNKLIELKKKKDELLQSLFYINLSDFKVKGESIEISNYKLKSQTFSIKLPKTNSEITDQGANLTTIEDFSITKLPIQYKELKSNIIAPCHHIYRTIEISIPENEALKIENNTSKIEAMLIFDLENSFTYKSSGTCSVEKNRYSPKQGLKPSFIRLIFAHKETGEIYYSQVFGNASTIPTNYQSNKKIQIINTDQGATDISQRESKQKFVYGNAGNSDFNQPSSEAKPNYDVNAFIRRNIKYPQDEKLAGNEATIFVFFSIDEEGKIYDVRANKSFSKAFEEEAIRVVQSMPEWKPAMQNGRAISTPSKWISVKFQLEDSEE